MRYILKPNLQGWPPEIPLVSGKYVKDFDIDEAALAPEWQSWLADKRAEAASNCIATQEALSRPMGFMRAAIPKSMELIEVAEPPK